MSLRGEGAARGTRRRGAHTPHRRRGSWAGRRSGWGRTRASACAPAANQDKQPAPSSRGDSVERGDLVPLPDRTGETPQECYLLPLNTREDSFFPTSYPSPRSEGIGLPVAAYSSGRDMDRNCGWGQGAPSGVAGVRCPGFPVPGSCSHLRGWKSGSRFSLGVGRKGRRDQDPEFEASWGQLCLPNYVTTVGPVSSERSRLSRPCILPGPIPTADANRAGCLGVPASWGPPREGKQLSFVALRIETRA